MRDKEYSAALRIFHWLQALTISLIVLTIFARKDWLEKYKIRDKIVDYAVSHGLTISHEQAYALAKSIRNEVWDYHYVLGIFLSVLLLYRVVLFFMPSGRKVLRLSLAYIKGDKNKKGGLSLLYLAVYLTIAILVVTGLGMYFYRELGISKESKELMESIHIGLVNVVIYFIPLHIFGVVLAELNEEPGIVSAMINGGRKESTSTADDREQEKEIGDA